MENILFLFIYNRLTLSFWLNPPHYYYRLMSLYLSIGLTNSAWEIMSQNKTFESKTKSDIGWHLVISNLFDSQHL